MLRDLRHSVRVLLEAKGWTAVVVISLALGIGANIALFAAINGLYLKKLAVKDPDMLVRITSVGRNQMATSTSDYGFTGKFDGQDVRSTFSYPMFRQFAADNRTMSDLLACAPIGRVTVVANGTADVASAFISSGNYYRMLGISAALGRTILPDDDQPAASPVAVISTRYWHSRFGGNPQIVGTVVHVNQVPVTIVGVLPANFAGVQQTMGELQDISMPLAIDPQINPGSPQVRSSGPRLDQATWWWLQVVGRLKPGATAAQVEGNLSGVFQQTARAGLDAYLATLPEDGRSTRVNQNRRDVPRLHVDSGSRGVYQVRTADARAVVILGGVVVLLLLIVCANVANLLLSRATNRYKELAIRLSLGATRARVVRQLLTESLLLASLGGVLGIALGVWGQRQLPGIPGRAMPLDWRVFAFIIGLTTLTGIIFGTAPALRGSHVNINDGLKESGRGVVGSRTILGKSLLIVQVAVSLVLLIGAGLFLRTVQNLRTVHVGFNPVNLLLFRVNPQTNQYDERRIASLYDELQSRLTEVPGVRAVTFSEPAMLTGSVSGTSIFVRGRTYGPGARDDINRVVVSPSFFETLEIPMLVGRGFTARDDERAPKVVVINEAAARKYFPNVDPLGHRFGSSIEDSGQLEIVGVLSDIKYDSVRDPAPPTMYVPYLQTSPRGMVFGVRTAGDPRAVVSSVREAARQVDSNVPLMDVTTQAESIETRYVQERLFARAYTLFGGIALLLASIGLFGLMSYSVSRRTNEIGVRMALGAETSRVLGLVLRESLTLVVIGVGIGIALALAASRVVASQLYGLAPHDVTTAVTAVVVMVIVSAIAGYVPARRASRVDPLVALRYE